MAEQVYVQVGGDVGVYDLSNVGATTWTQIGAASFISTTTGTNIVNTSGLTHFIEVRYVNRSQNTHYMALWASPAPGVTADQIQCLPDTTTVVNVRGVRNPAGTASQFVTDFFVKLANATDPGQIIAVFDLA